MSRIPNSEGESGLVTHPTDPDFDATSQGPSRHVLRVVVARHQDAVTQGNGYRQR